MGLLDALAEKLLRRPRAIVTGWLLAALASAYFATQLVDSCRFQFDPVPGTASYDAQVRFQQDFPQAVSADVEVVLIACRDRCESIAEAPFAVKAVDALSAKCASLDAEHPGMFQNWTDHFSYSRSAAARLSRRSPFLAASNQTMIFQLTWQVFPRNQHIVQGMLLQLQALVDDLDNQGAAPPEGPAVSLALTGPLALFHETLASTRQDIEAKDVFVAPFALLVLLYRIRSWRLIILPAICLICSVATGFGLFLPFSLYVVDISPLAPTAMAFLSIALSIDYSLFLLTRFVEEVNAGARTEDAIRIMLRHSGHVVLVSGTVLIICYLGVLFFPGGGISTVGLGAAFSILVCIASNLTLTPCAIAAFPKFFTPKAASGSACRCPWRRGGSGGGAGEGREALAPGAPRLQQHGCWLRVADAVTRPPGVWLVPLLCLGLLLPAVLEVFAYRESFANSLTFPRSGRATEAHATLVSEFPAGEVAPAYVVLPAPSDAVSTDEAAATAALEQHFDELCALAGRLLENLSQDPFGVRPEHITSLALVPPIPPLPPKLACLHWNSAATDELHPLPFAAKALLARDDEAGQTYRELWGRLMSRTNRSSMVVLTAPFDPFSEALRPFVHQARKALPAPGAASSKSPSSAAWVEAEGVEADGSGRDAMLLSSLAIVVDILEVSYARFPYILLGTILLVFSVIAGAFRAALAPVKMFFTVVVPLAAVFGVAVWVYQDKALHWLGVPALTSGAGAGFYWGTPIFTCTIIIGLALDYDVFLFARVVELRRSGFDNAAAVRGAVCLTGPIITSAGLIMAIALGGLLLCDVPANNQIGFVMAFGVLVDTFVIRTCLVPAVLTLAAGLNYWPQVLPQPIKNEEDLLELVRSEGRQEARCAPPSPRDGRVP